MSKSQTYFHPETAQYVALGSAFKLGSVSYPDNWIELASDQEIEGIGLVPVTISGEAQDVRFYDNSEDTQGAVTTITATPKDPDVVRALKWEEVKAIRSQLVKANLAVEVSAGAVVGFQADADSRVQYLTLKDRARDMLSAAAAPTDQVMFGTSGVVWKTAENAYVPITIELIYSIVEKLAIRELLIFAAGEQKAVALQASQDPASFDTATGWGV